MFKLEYDESANILLIAFNENSLSNASFRPLVHDVHQAINVFDKNRSMNRLFDLGKLTVPEIDMALLKDFSQITNIYNKEYQNIKIAIVTSTNLMFGEFRAYEVYAALPGIERRIFRSLEEARAWLIQ